MAGLYIHIPFCKSRCLYCDFYSTTSLDIRQRYVDALCRELDLRGKSGVDTIYIGGGTPSQLSFEQLQQLHEGYTFELEQKPDEQVQILANGHCIGQGEWVQINDRLGVRVTHLSLK